MLFRSLARRIAKNSVSICHSTQSRQPPAPLIRRPPRQKCPQQKRRAPTKIARHKSHANAQAHRLGTDSPSIIPHFDNNSSHFKAFHPKLHPHSSHRRFSHKAKSRAKSPFSPLHCKAKNPPAPPPPKALQESTRNFFQYNYKFFSKTY